MTIVNELPHESSSSSYFFPKGYKKLSSEELARKKTREAPRVRTAVVRATAPTIVPSLPMARIPTLPTVPNRPKLQLSAAELLPWKDGTIKQSIELASKHDIHTLIVGETGTGKELIALEIHERRKRRKELSNEDAPFVAVNCGAIPEALAESILFGHERGAFTSARERQYGKFEIARQGTIFLDEIQSLPLPIQVKLLRVLQNGELERLGSKSPVKIQCQVIAASNVPLELLIDRKIFRRDLYFRLNICPFYLPSLRERKTEIPRLIALMFKKIRTEHGLKEKTLSPESLAYFIEYSWPGNLRELEHSLLFACLQTESSIIKPANLPANLTGALNKFIDNGNWMLV